MTKLFRALANIMTKSAIFSLLVLMSSCSFHSNQWDAIKRLMRPSEVMIQDRWFLSGPVNKMRVYPVQVSDAILFTDGEDVMLKFDGWHFVEIRGLPISSSESTSNLQSSLVFYYNVDETLRSGSEKEKLLAKGSINSGDSNEIVYEVNCEAWREVPLMAGKLLSQSCSIDGQEAFSNSIWLDQSGNIRGIESALGPGGVKVHVAVGESK